MCEVIALKTSKIVMAMRDRIMTLLRDLEAKHEIKILMAVNYGSRSFGYSSEGSDWDVRFIYVHRPEWYFSLANESDVIEIMLEDEHLDIEGYDLKKALTLMSKTNPIESDWLHSGDFFILDEEFRAKMWEFESACYNPHHAMYHFYSIGVKHNQRFLDIEVTLKRFIYYMRGLLSCRWVEANGSHPPVNVDELIDATILDNDAVRAKAHALLELKRCGKFNDMSIVDEELSAYIFNIQHYYEELLPRYIDTKPQADIPAMSKFLMETVLNSWHI